MAGLSATTTSILGHGRRAGLSDVVLISAVTPMRKIIWGGEFHGTMDYSGDGLCY